MSSESIKIGVVGLGTVGSAVVRALRRNRALVRARCGVDVEVWRVAEKDPGKLRASRLPARCLSQDFRDILNDPEIRIVVELIGGTTVAHEVVLGALRAGKHVVTANKALLSKFWPEIFSLAHERRRTVCFESSVMAGVPVIRTLEQGLSGNSILSLLGILNGTTNFILTRMASRGMEFGKALAEARKRGLCEADASLDIEGHDAAQKLAILGSISLGKWLPPEAIHCEGIAHIDRLDMNEARDEFGYVVRPLAILKRLKNDLVEARVHPTFVPLDHPLAAIQHEYNALLIEADTAGPITLAGKGAGGMPAASGVIGDIIGVARAMHQSGDAQVLVPLRPSEQPLRVAPMEDVECKFYLRFSVVDRPGVLAFITGALGAQQVSIASCHQRGRAPSGIVSVFVITHKAREGALRKALAQIDANKRIVKRKTTVIRIEE